MANNPDNKISPIGQLVEIKDKNEITMDLALELRALVRDIFDMEEKKFNNTEYTIEKKDELVFDYKVLKMLILDSLEHIKGNKFLVPGLDHVISEFIDKNIYDIPSLEFDILKNALHFMAKDKLKLVKFKSPNMDDQGNYPEIKLLDLKLKSNHNHNDNLNPQYYKIEDKEEEYLSRLQDHLNLINLEDTHEKIESKEFFKKIILLIKQDIIAEGKDLEVKIPFNSVRKALVDPYKI